jgi:hypothetical protein
LNGENNQLLVDERAGNNVGEAAKEDDSLEHQLELRNMWEDHF